MKTRLEEFTDLTPAEKRLRDEVCLGGFVLFGKAEGQTEIGKGKYVPDADADDDDAPTITADFLRYLALGGCEGLNGTIPATGVRIAGVRVSGQLSLEAEEVIRDIALVDCLFDWPPVIRSARLRSLFLNGSTMPGLQGDRVTMTGDLVMRRITTTGGDYALRLAGADLGGALDCNGARLRAGGTGTAMDAEGLRTADTTRFDDAEISGAARLNGARIGGVLNLDTKEWKTAETGNDEGFALRCDGARIDGAILARDGGRIDGVVDFSSARAGVLVDAPGKWPGDGRLFLDRFIYGAFTGRGVPTDAPTRIAWLDSQVASHLADEFKPQPWEQCARVLRESGHVNAAREVLVEKEKRQRRARRNRLLAQGRVWTARRHAAGDWVLGLTTRYGRDPLRAFLPLLAVFLLGWVVFGAADNANQIKPNAAFVLRGDEWAKCAEPPAASIGWRRGTHPSQRACFEAQPEAASYPRFNAFVYSADTLLPIVSMEMQEFWLPDETAGTLGSSARYYLWLHIALGWALSLLAVAGFSGLIKQDNT